MGRAGAARDRGESLQPRPMGQRIGRDRLNGGPYA